ncbi:MAG: hypothetical protein K6G69_08685 [Lachnospiraceae bacterium]|nr:hypothetical protein [Lachnospiraceae bacterium]
MDEKELQRMIEEIEQGEMVKAPGYLKQEIFDRIDEQEKEKVRKIRNKKLNFVLYTIEVAAVSIAAVILVFMVPMLHRDDNIGKSNNYYTEQIHKTLDEDVAKYTDRFVNWMDYVGPVIDDIKEEYINERF